MKKQIKFNSEVKRAVFMKKGKPERCIKRIASVPLADENEVSLRNTEFQIVNKMQKRQLHEYHVQKRKKCRLYMRQDIIDAFWCVFEEQVWKCFLEIKGEETFSEQTGLEAILSVDKNEVNRLWREQLMITFPVIEQHEMVPFHDRWLQRQFKDESNIAEMQRRLLARATSSHWLSDLVSELATSPDSQDTVEINYEALTEALGDLESLNPEIVEELLPQDSIRDDEDLKSPSFNTLEQILPQESLSETEFGATDSQLIKAMESWEGQQIENALDLWNYNDLLAPTSPSH